MAFKVYKGNVESPGHGDIAKNVTDDRLTMESTKAADEK